MQEMQMKYTIYTHTSIHAKIGDGPCQSYTLYCLSFFTVYELMTKGLAEEDTF